MSDFFNIDLALELRHLDTFGVSDGLHGRDVALQLGDVLGLLLNSDVLLVVGCLCHFDFLVQLGDSRVLGVLDVRVLLHLGDGSLCALVGRKHSGPELLDGEDGVWIICGSLLKEHEDNLVCLEHHVEQLPVVVLVNSEANVSNLLVDHVRNHHDLQHVFSGQLLAALREPLQLCELLLSLLNLLSELLDLSSLVSGSLASGFSHLG